MFCLMFEVLNQYKIFQALSTCCTGTAEELKMLKWYYEKCKVDIQKSKLMDMLMCNIIIILAFVLMFFIMVYEIPFDYWHIRFLPSFLCFGIVVSRVTLGRHFNNRAIALYALYEVFIAVQSHTESSEEQVRT